jgi:hypothetical protein
MIMVIKESQREMKRMIEYTVDNLRLSLLDSLSVGCCTAVVMHGANHFSNARPFFLPRDQMILQRFVHSSKRNHDHPLEASIPKRDFQSNTS